MSRWMAAIRLGLITQAASVSSSFSVAENDTVTLLLPGLQSCQPNAMTLPLAVHRDWAITSANSMTVQSPQPTGQHRCCDVQTAADSGC